MEECRPSVISRSFQSEGCHRCQCEKPDVSIRSNDLIQREIRKYNYVRIPNPCFSVFFSQNGAIAEWCHRRMVPSLLIRKTSRVSIRSNVQLISYRSSNLEPILYSIHSVSCPAISSPIFKGAKKQAKSKLERSKLESTIIICSILSEPPRRKQKFFLLRGWRRIFF
jgi:hypothetical protein